MNPDPVAVLVIAGVSLAGALTIVALAVACAWAAPWIEGWLARREGRLLGALALSEDAALPYAAKRRARELFLAKLDARQRRSWQLRRRFNVLSSGGRRYTISRYRPFNISTADAAFCVAVAGTIPVYDKLLAQKLLLECNEQLFLARANVRTFSRSWERLMAAARAQYPAPQ